MLLAFVGHNKSTNLEKKRKRKNFAPPPSKVLFYSTSINMWVNNFRTEEEGRGKNPGIVRVTSMEIVNIASTKLCANGVMVPFKIT